jgi:hypothetical protein
MAIAPQTVSMTSQEADLDSDFDPLALCLGSVLEPSRCDCPPPRIENPERTALSFLKELKAPQGFQSVETDFAPLARTLSHRWDKTAAREF